MQQITILGNLGKDAVIKSTNGKEVVLFNVCVNSDYKNANGETVKRSNWYSCIYKGTSVAKYIKKGDLILVEGELNPRIYVNDKKEASLDLTVSVIRIELLNNKRDDAGQ